MNIDIYFKYILKSYVFLEEIIFMLNNFYAKAVQFDLI